MTPPAMEEEPNAGGEEKEKEVGQQKRLEEGESQESSGRAGGLLQTDETGEHAAALSEMNKPGNQDRAGGASAGGGETLRYRNPTTR